MSYRIIISGRSKSDGKFYELTNICDGMSYEEIEQCIEEQNFEKKTVVIKKEKM